MDVGALLQHSQYAIPIGIVLACAILVFVFGFKNAEQPPFAQLTSGSDVDRKSAGKKRNKIKEKVRAANGQVNTEKASPAKKVALVKAEAVKKTTANTEETVIELKERKHEDNKPAVARKEKTVAAPKSGKENKVEQVKNRKNLKNNSQEKPVDFDDGDWEQPAYARKEKKNKKKDDDTPSKKSKKEGKKIVQVKSDPTRNEKEQSKHEVKDKVAKDTENKELKEKDKKEVVLTPVADVQPVTEIIENKEEEEVLEKVEKLEKLEKPEKTEEKKSSKLKKAKKAVETESARPTSPKAEKPEKVAKVEKVVEEERNPKVLEKEAPEEKKIEKVQENNSVVFDELGDVWTEAKPQKKSKKKARKDN